tara:strand:+ start:234 stop:392 length:159 start_codon:yes stop_codon:yes gene_type:complete
LKKLTLKEKLKRISLQKKKEVREFFSEDAEIKAINLSAFRRIFNNLTKNKEL